MATPTGAALTRELGDLCGPGALVEPGATRDYLHDATEHQGLRGEAAAVVLPATEDELAAVMGWCYEHDVAMVPRGGGTGFSGGAVPLGGEVVIGVERLDRVLSLDPGLWRMRVEAGVTTGTVRRLARENGLLFPPDPGAGEQSHIGGNIAANAGGPHAFKYGVTGTWVTGLRAVLPSGEVIDVGGPIRKDVAGYDIAALMVGSEGTLGIVSSAWLRLIPAPEVAAPIAAVYPDIATGCRALRAVVEAGLVPAALEYLDAGSVSAAAGAFPVGLPDEAGFMVIAEADGSEAEVEATLGELREVLGAEALLMHEPSGRGEVEALWRWRDGVSIAVAAVRGGKMSEDIAVPFEALEEAIVETLEIGERHELETCSWGHAGDANLHSTFLLDAGDQEQVSRAEAAAQDLFSLALRLNGTVSGEHGLGWVKRDQLDRQWTPETMEVHRAIKRAFDPKGLMNPGKKD